MSSEAGDSLPVQSSLRDRSNRFEAESHPETFFDCSGCGISTLPDSSPDWNDRSKAKAWLDTHFQGGREDQSKLLQYLLSLIDESIDTDGAEELLTDWERRLFRSAKGFASAIEYRTATHKVDPYYPEFTGPSDQNGTVYIQSTWAEIKKEHEADEDAETSQTTNKKILHWTKESSPQPASAVSRDTSPRTESSCQNANSMVPSGARQPTQTLGVAARSTRSTSPGTQLWQLDQDGLAETI